MKSILVVLALTVGGTALAAQSVTITNTPLPVSVTNTNQSVTVTNSSLPVQVENTSPIPVTVSPSEEPFHVNPPIGSLVSGSTGSFATVQLVTVPAGKRLIVEHVSLLLNLSGANGVADAHIWTSNAVIADDNDDEIDCHQTGGDSLNHWFSCSVTTKVYANAGDTLHFSVQAVDTNGGQYRIFVSGHYVPAP